jgi:transcriptional regulator with XRE-family HTH domain
MTEASTSDRPEGIGARLRNVRKRRGMTQAELSETSGVSAAWVKKIERDDAPGIRMETLHKLAAALGVPTSALAAESPITVPEHGDIAQWEQVRAALDHPVLPDDGQPTPEGLAGALGDAVADVIGSRYGEVRDVLPGLLRDADALVSVSADGVETKARLLRSQTRQLAAFMLGQTWQFGPASRAIGLATTDADGDLTAMAAADWQCWLLIRQGRFAEAIDLAARWADQAEPRMSSATPDELAAWGRFLIRIATAAARDNRPDEARDALRLAKMAAAGMSTDIIPRFNRWQVFGPLTVRMFEAQDALIRERPDVALRIGPKAAPRRFPLPETWHRYQLDIARAHVSLREYGDAVGVLQDVRAEAPEWLLEQHYARDILGRVIQRRRTLTPDMRELADAVRLPL